MPFSEGIKVLQIGVGGFGRNHLRAWHEMGMGSQLWVAELSTERQKECSTYNIPRDHISTDYRDFLANIDVVDIVTPTQSHFDLCAASLGAGKDVFVEKPMTLNAKEAERVVALVEEARAVFQVGYYYRFHPFSSYIKEKLERSELGEIRYLSGNFMGFKRARTDVGVTHTDAIHFLDLFNWFLGQFPEQVYAVTRDHFGRGLEDMSLVLLTYPGGKLAKIESGYIQPGRWWDKVVPNAQTTKEVVIAGSNETAEVDFESETLTFHRVHHENRDGVWTPVLEGSTAPNVGTANTIQLLCREFSAFLRCVETRTQPSANAWDSGVALAKLIEGVYESAKLNKPITMSW